MIDNTFKVPAKKMNDKYRDPRRELERMDYEGMPKGQSSIANLDPMGFQKEVYYEMDKQDGVN
jgi:hypothetical protein